MRKLLLLTILSLCGIATAMAQVGGVTGRVVSRVGRAPIGGAKVVLSTSPEMVTTTDSDGVFEFAGVPYGIYDLSVDVAEFIPTQISVKVDLPMRNVNFITLVQAAMTQDLDAANFADFDMESGGTSQELPSSLSASRDVFDNIAGYTFGQMRFRKRGYDSATEEVYMNGIRLNDAITGFSPWSLWSGLNDATRNQESESALGTNRYGVGGVNGITQINARASELRTGFRTSLVGASAQYLTRVMATYASGMQDNGWAYAFSVSTRQGPNLAVKGVYYDAWAYYAGVEKQFNSNHRLSLTALGVPTQRGAQMAATQEVYDLVGSNFYNPNWGYQNGKLRNARVRDYHEPLVIANYDWQISDKFKFEAAASYRFGKNGYSALDWNNAADPKPDYHRNLPSYYDLREQYDKSDVLKEYWGQNNTDYTQINWDRIYNINYNSTNNVDKAKDPNGNLLEDGRSVYIISERHTDQNDFNLRGTFTYQMNSASVLRFGLAGRMNVTNYYTSVKDLLGGQYWVNVDNFAERDFGSSSLAMYNDIINYGDADAMGNPDNFIVKEGEKYGYDYYAHVTNAQGWITYSLQKGGFEGVAATEFGYASFYKDSKYRKGLFPDNSYGKSEQPEFFTYKLKMNTAYNFNPQHRLAFSGIVTRDAPTFDDGFVAPRTRNSLTPHLKASQMFGGDLTYSMRTPFLTLRASLYYTYIKDLNRMISFYDDLQNGFTNFAMSGIDQQHMGLEFGFRIPIITEMNISGALNLGDYRYANNPIFTQTADNSANIVYEDEVVRWKGYKVESTPQTAANLSVNFRTGNNWFFSLTASYYDNLYLSMNPLLRTDMLQVMLIDTLGEEAGIAEYNKNKVEEKLDPAFLLGINVGHNWYVNYRYQLGFSLDVRNVLNNTNIKTGGFEQMRIHEPSRTSTEYSAFDSKYYYLFGLNIYLNLYLRF